MKAMREEAAQILENALLLALLDQYEQAQINNWITQGDDGGRSHAKVGAVREIKQYLTNKAKVILDDGNSDAA